MGVVSVTQTNGVNVKKFGQKLRQLRAQQRISQRALARKVKVSPGAIQLYEQKNSIPSADIVGRIARLFEVSTDYLIYDDHDALERVQDRDLMNYFAKADQLHHRFKFLVKEFIDSVVAREQLEAQQTVAANQKPSRGSRHAA